MDNTTELLMTNSMQLVFILVERVHSFIERTFSPAVVPSHICSSETCTKSKKMTVTMVTLITDNTLTNLSITGMFLKLCRGETLKKFKQRTFHEVDMGSVSTLSRNEHSQKK